MAMYDRQVKTAKRLIAKFGAPVVVKNKTITPNPVKPWETIENVSQHTVPVCFLTLDSAALKTLSITPGTEVPKGASLALMGAVNFEVSLTTTFEHDGKTWAMYWMDKLAPNGRPILFTMVLGA